MKNVHTRRDRPYWLAVSIMVCACGADDEQPSYAAAIARHYDWHCGCVEELGGAELGARCRQDAAQDVSEAECRERAAADSEVSAHGAQLECEARRYDALSDCKTACTDAFFVCADGSDVIDVLKFCDGAAQCEDGSDESADCEPLRQHVCGDGTSLLPFEICDGWPSCMDGSDEEDCPVTCEYSANREEAQCSMAHPAEAPLVEACGG